VKEFEMALERSRAYARLAQGFWRPKDLTPIPSLKGRGSPPASGEGPGERFEYDRLFSHRTTVLCPIYEVEYDKNRAVSQGPTLADIAGFYRAFGLEIIAHERPDHLALELEFLSVLSYKEVVAFRNNLLEQAEICRDAQRKFLEAHLGRWIKPFAEILMRESQLEFYTTLANTLKGFIESECAVLDAHPEIVTVLPTDREVSEVRCRAACT
jgi:TorA maturation chaperone TorD